jgi:hypothetical protein
MVSDIGLAILSLLAENEVVSLTLTLSAFVLFAVPSFISGGQWTLTGRRTVIPACLTALDSADVPKLDLPGL